MDSGDPRKHVLDKGAHWRHVATANTIEPSICGSDAAFCPIFTKRQSCRLIYRKRLKENQRLNTEVYTNDLHDALLKKNSSVFWQCWRSKFKSNILCKLIQGCAEAAIIADKFASHFRSVFSCNDPQKANSIKQDYVSMRANYCGLP